MQSRFKLFNLLMMMLLLTAACEIIEEEDDIVDDDLPEENQSISANITEDTQWPDVFEDPNVPDYRVSRSISVNAQLTIEPGVIVEFANDAQLSINTEGSLIAQGAPEDSIIFTGATKSPGFWQGIVFYSPNANNTLSYVRVSYGGSSAIGYGIPKVNLGIDNGEKVSISNSKFSFSDGYGIFIDNDGELLNFSQNSFEHNNDHPLALDLLQATNLDMESTFSNNSIEKVEIIGSGVSSSSEVNLRGFNDGTPYFVSGGLTVNSGLKISNGAMLRFDSDVALTVNSEGYLIVEGTETEKIIFTGDTETSGFWKGIVFYSNDIKNSIDQANIGYGGSSSFGYGMDKANVCVDNDEKISITNTEIHSSGGYGMYMDYGELTGFSNNVLRDNEFNPLALDLNAATMLDATSDFNSGNGDNSVELLSSNFEEAGVIKALSNNTPYYASGNLSINADMEIEAGANFEFGSDYGIVVNNDGSLTVSGVSGNEVSFTGKTKVPGAWSGIVFYSNNVKNVIDYAIIRHGGSSDIGYGMPKVNISVDNNERLTVTNSEITDSAGWGIYNDNANSFSESNNSFNNNAAGNVYGN